MLKPGYVPVKLLWWWSRSLGGSYLPPTSTTMSHSASLSGLRVRMISAFRNSLVNFVSITQART